jgi:hypothetical protein
LLLGWPSAPDEWRLRRPGDAALMNPSQARESSVEFSAALAWRESKLAAVRHAASFWPANSRCFAKKIALAHLVC